MQVRSLGRGWPSVGAVGQDGFAIKVCRFLWPHPQPFGPDATGTVASSWMPLAMAAVLPQCLPVEEYRLTVARQSFRLFPGQPAPLPFQWGTLTPAAPACHSPVFPDIAIGPARRHHFHRPQSRMQR